MSPAQGLRERKKHRTRHHLATVAVELFLARGYDGVTMDDIAEAADVGSRTVFRYFGDKAELVFADEELVDQELRRMLSSLPAEEPAWPAVTATMLHLTTLWGDLREEGRRRRTLVTGSSTLGARHLVKLSRHAEVIADQLVRRGTGRESARVIGRTAVAAFDCAVDRWLDDSRLPLEEALREALAVLHDSPPST